MVLEFPVRVLALSLACALLGCVSARQAPSPKTPSPDQALAAPAPAAPAFRAPAPQELREAPALAAPPASQETVRASAPPEPPSARVAGFLPQGLVVLQISDSTLLVKRNATTPPASLFEESIALSKLRGQLKTRAGIPRGTAEKSSLRAGTASLVFAGPLPAAEAAGAISAALSLDGIQRVRAVLAP